MTKLSDEMRRQLIAGAQQAQQRAYARYSHYLVGAALLASNGDIYLGCNIENASFSATCCAERVAVFRAVSEGVHQFDAVVVVTKNGVAPCGVCRQVLYEFSPDLLVITIDEAEHITFEGTLRELLPRGFDSEQLADATP